MNELSIYSEKQVAELHEKRVMQHNAITSGRFDFDACQLDIMFILLATLKEGELNYKVNVKDIELLTGRQWNYQQLRKATEDMGSRMFEINLPKGEKNIYRQLWIFQKVDYVEGSGTLEIMLTEPSIPYFFQLKNSFTSIQLKSVLSCSSKYAKRLYTLACQWRSVGHKIYDIIELKNMLGMIDKKGNEQYIKISQFQSKVLEVAKAQINQNTDIYFDYKLHKSGRSFKAIELFINHRPNVQLQIDFQKPLVEQKTIKTIMHYGLSEQQAIQIAEKVSLNDFQKLMDDLNKKVSKREIKVENSVGYIVGVYKKKGVIKE